MGYWKFNTLRMVQLDSREDLPYRLGWQYTQIQPPSVRKYVDPTPHVSPLYVFHEFFYPWKTCGRKNVFQVREEEEMMGNADA
jgi:hypothetical protein